jgi:glycine betaine catabolism B
MESVVESCILQQSPVVSDRFSQSSTWERADAQWPSHEERTLVCCRVSDETHDVRTFVFASEAGQPFSFEPGQFITVGAQIEGQAVSRCYTISSPPTRPYTLSITVKRTPGGVMSNWLHANMAPGKTLSAFGPAGIFTPSAGPSQKALYLSAGSGVTPLMAMTRAAFDLGQNRDVVFVHSARTPDDIIFANELAALEQVSGAFRVIHICEAQGSEGNWEGPIGRLSLDLLKARVPDYREREVFTCGPAGYMDAVRKLLLDGQHDPVRYHQESFNFAETVEVVEAEPRRAPGEQTSSFVVRLARSGKTFSMEASETVLAAARKAGVPLPSSCSQGICGTCKTKLLEGTVEMKHNGGIRPREIDKGLRLMCCSKPTSDLVLDL